MTKYIALISEHASPLGTFGVQRRGVRTYVGQLAKYLAALAMKLGRITRDSYELPEIVNWMDGVRIIHVTTHVRA